MPPVNRQYSDINLDFIPHPVTGDIVRLTGADAVKRSIRNLVLTSNYEIWFQPEKGSVVHHSLFENISTITEYKIKTSITDVITRFEPRAELIDVTVQAKPDENGYTATITFGVHNLIDPITISVFLERVR